MMNVMLINGQEAVIQFDPEINLFRGEFIGLSGGADFYGPDIHTLQKEGELSLKTYLQACAEQGIEPRKQFSGKLSLRLGTQTHERAAIVAAARGKSLNEWILQTIEAAIAAA